MEIIQSLLENNAGAIREIKWKQKVCVRARTHVCNHMRGKVFVLSHTWSMRATERFPKEVQEPPQLSKEN